jgi:hypothetical protein
VFTDVVRFDRRHSQVLWSFVEEFRRLEVELAREKKGGEGRDRGLVIAEFTWRMG